MTTTRSTASPDPLRTNPRWMTWLGWILSVLPSLMLFFSAYMKFTAAPEVMEGFTGKFGYPDNVLLPLAIVEVTCAVLYLFPPTAMLGAILIAGYLGGAIATHVRVGENKEIVAPIVLGVLVWLGLYLREPRLRALVPWRR